MNAKVLSSLTPVSKVRWSAELRRMHDLWWPWGNILMGSIIYFPCLWLALWVKGLEFHRTLPPLSTFRSPVSPPRNHESLLDLDQFRDLALWAADPSLLVMPAWKASLTGHVEGQGPASFLSGPSCELCLQSHEEWLLVPARPHPPPFSLPEAYAGCV